MNDAVVPLERAELEATADVHRAATADIVDACGVAVRELEEGAVLAATRLDVLALNRALGLGLTARPTDTALEEVLGAFEDIGSPRFFLQVAPVDATRDLGERLEALGLRHYNNWVRLSRELHDVPEARPSAVTVRRIGPEDAVPFSEIVARAFGYPPSAALMAGCVVGRPGWHHYLAYLGDDPIGSAAMFVVGEAAWFGFAATEKEHRGRGAQTALVLRRLRDAAAEGCRWVSVETAEQTPEREAPSYRNLIRLGFTEAYLRPNYLWVRDGQA